MKKAVLTAVLLIFVFVLSVMFAACGADNNTGGETPDPGITDTPGGGADEPGDNPGQTTPEPAGTTVEDAIGTVIYDLTDGFVDLSMKGSVFTDYAEYRAAIRDDDPDTDRYIPSMELEVYRDDATGDIAVYICDSMSVSEGGECAGVQEWRCGKSPCHTVSLGNSGKEIIVPTGSIYGDGHFDTAYIEDYIGGGKTGEIFDEFGIDLDSDWTMEELRETIRSKPISEMVDFVKAFIEPVLNDLRDSDYILYTIDLYAGIFGNASFNDLDEIIASADENGDVLTGEKGLAFEFLEYLFTDCFEFTVAEDGDTVTLTLTVDREDKLGYYVAEISDLAECMRDDVDYTLQDAFKKLIGVDIKAAYDLFASAFKPNITMEDAANLILDHVGDYGITLENIFEFLRCFMIEGLSVEYYNEHKSDTLSEIVPDISFNYDTYDTYDELKEAVDQYMNDFCEPGYLHAVLDDLAYFVLVDEFELGGTIDFTIVNGKLTAIDCDMTAFLAAAEYRDYGDYSAMPHWTEMDFHALAEIEVNAEARAPYVYYGIADSLDRSALSDFAEGKDLIIKKPRGAFGLEIGDFILDEAVIMQYITSHGGQDYVEYSLADCTVSDGNIIIPGSYFAEPDNDDISYTTRLVLQIPVEIIIDGETYVYNNNVSCYV